MEPFCINKLFKTVIYSKQQILFVLKMLTLRSLQLIKLSYKTVSSFYNSLKSYVPARTESQKLCGSTIESEQSVMRLSRHLAILYKVSQHLEIVEATVLFKSLSLWTSRYPCKTMCCIMVKCFHWCVYCI